MDFLLGFVYWIEKICTMIRIRILFVIYFLFCLSGWAQQRLPAFEMNEKLGRGINMGNSFEAPSETAWGNPWDPEYFEIMEELGFQHVRLPVRWEPAARSMATAPYTITPSFLERIQEVVDNAIEHNLYIIVNMHHHEALFENPAGEKARFLSQWSQIANYFKDYPENLLFEVLNEPHGNISAELWNEYFADALAEIRITNPTRVVLMGVAEFGGLGAISKLELPEDEYIILSPHYYNPFPFTHQGAEWVDGADAWLGTTWNDTEADRETVENEFSYALQFSEENNIPIHVGEFGAYSTADEDSRERWTTFLARWFEEQNLSWAYWEFSAGFGIYNPATKTFNTSLIDALFHNEMPVAIPITIIPIYTSNFSSGTDGWIISNQGGASSTLTSSGGKLNVSITNGGTQSWHIQLVKNNIPLKKDKQYKISFLAQSAVDRSLTFYAGKASDPWNAYSGYNGINISTTETTVVSSFMMTDPSDLSARLVFDLGTSTTNLSITNVKVEEIQIGIATDIFGQERKPIVVAYPNPVQSVLHLKGVEMFHSAEIYDIVGKKVMRFTLDEETTNLHLEDVPQGLYFVRLYGMGISEVVKVLKE